MGAGRCRSSVRASRLAAKGRAPRHDERGMRGHLRKISGAAAMPRGLLTRLAPAELGLTRVRPLYDLAQVGNIRLALARGVLSCKGRGEERNARQKAQA